MNEPIILNQNPNLVQPLEIKPKMKLWKRILLGMVIFLVVAGAVVYNIPRILSFCCGQDSPLLDDSDLRLAKVEVPDEENGFYDLEKITNEMIYEPFAGFAVKYVMDPKEWDSPLVLEVLTKNQQGLELFSIASAKPFYQLPAYADPEKISINSPLYPFYPTRTYARLVNIKALQLARQGEFDVAMKEANKTVRLGYNMAKSNPIFLSYLNSLGIKKDGLYTMLSILPYTSFEKQQYVELRDEVSKYEDGKSGLNNALKETYLHQKNGVLELAKERNIPIDKELQALLEEGLEPDREYLKAYKFKGNKFYFKPNQTIGYYANHTRSQIQKGAEGCGEESGNDSEKKFARLTPKTFITQNFLGKFLYDVTATDFNEVFLKVCEETLLLNVVKTQLALKAYQVDSRDLPTNLEILVPEYLSKVPLDPFDKQPLRYNSEKKIIYSVGINKKDVGGSEGEDWTKMENPTFKIEF